MSEYLLSSTPLQGLQNHEAFQIVWLDPDNHITQEVKNMTEFLEQCSTIEQCIKYIKSVKNDQSILLVLADSFDRIMELHRYNQIHLIYVLNNNNQQQIKRKYPESVRFFSHEKNLVEHLRRDIILTYRYDLPISLSSIDSMNNDQSLIVLDETTFFYWNQLFIHYLVHDENVKSMDQLKQEMIEQCRSEYANNEPVLKKIAEFENDCTVDKCNALKWYCADTFAFRLLNKAFRTRNIHLICKFRYFIILIYNELKQLSDKQRGVHVRTIYRGQRIKPNELEILKSNVRQAISFNTIISTTRDEAVARMFVADAELAIIFEIHMPNHVDNSLCPFADISQKSSYKNEEEILFFAGMTFQVDSIEKETESIYRIQLTCTNENTQLVMSLNNSLQRFTKDLPSLCSSYPIALDCYLFKTYHKYLVHETIPLDEGLNLIVDVCDHCLIDNIYDRTRSIQYYKSLLLNRTLINNRAKTIALNVIIANNYLENTEYDNAFVYYGIAYSLINGDNLLTAEIFTRLGDIWTALNCTENAMSCFERAFRFISDDSEYHEKLIELLKKIMKVCPKSNYDQYEAKMKKIIDYDATNCKYTNKKISVQAHKQYNYIYNPNRFREAVELFKDGKNSLQQCNPIAGLFKCKAAVDEIKKYYSIFDRSDYLLCINYEIQAGAHLISNDILSALIAWKKSIDIRMNLIF